MKKGLACIVTGCLTASLFFPTFSGAEGVDNQVKGDLQAKSLQASVPYKDLGSSWSQSAVLRMQNMDLLQGYADGTFKPNHEINRAEFVMILDRVFGFTGGTETHSFTDVTAGDWYYDALTRANGSGIIQGTDVDRLSPKQPITREEAAVMVDRAFQLSSGVEDEKELSKFHDANDISNYTKKALTFLTSNHIMKGYQGKLNPKFPITRAETASLLAAMIADIKTSPGTYESSVGGNLIVRSSDVTLKNTIIKGNLLLTEGIGEGSVVLQGVTVTGSVIVKGGGSHSIDISDSKLNRIVIDKSGEPVSVKIKEGSNVQEITVMQKASVELSSDSSIDSLTVLTKANHTQINSKGKINKLKVDAANVVVNGETVKPGFVTSIKGESTQPVPSQPGNSTTDSSTSSPSSPGGQTPSVPDSPSNEKPPTTIPDEDWKLVWNDEFNGPVIDDTKWTVQDTGLVYNNELQYYSPNNTRIVKDEDRSVLQIEAKREEKSGQKFTSGKLISMGKGDFTYGKVVVRAKLPKEQGMWPAFWMMPTDEAHYGGWPASGEIDIMELIGGEDSHNKIYSTLHYDSVKSDGSHGHDQGSITLPDGESFADDYHDFQVEWLPGMIRFSVDGKVHHEVTNWQTKAPGQPEYYTFPAPFDRPFYLILNLAVGGDWPGSPNDDFTSEAMNVDFVRVYSYDKLDKWPDVTTNPIEPEAQREPQKGGNQIYNDQFLDGTETNGVPQKWQFITNEGGSGSVKVVEDKEKGKAVQVTIDKEGTQNYSVQLTQMPIYVKKNKKYKIEFDAKASADRTISSKVTQFEKSWTNYSGDHPFEITTEWKTYDYTFDMRDGTDNNARFEFNLGLDNDTVLISNVKLSEVGEADPLTVERKPLPDGNYIFNGTFDQGKNRLGFWSSHIAENAVADISVNNFLKFPIMERQLVVDVKKTNGDSEQVVVTQGELKLEANTTYGYSFEAKADAPHTVNIDLISSGADSKQSHQSQSIQLGKDLKTYTGEIRIGDIEPDTTSTFRLLFGSSTGKVYVDNVRLTKRGNPISVDGYAHIPATEAWSMQGLQLENSDEGGQHISHMEEGDLLQYKINVAADADYVISARMASAKDDSSIRFSVKDEEGSTVVQSVYALGNTGSWQKYNTVYFPAVSLKAGKNYYVDFEGKDYNTRWVDISQNKVKDGKLALAEGNWEKTPEKLVTSDADGGGVLIHLPGTSKNWWDVLLQQRQIKLDEGKTYRLAFEASASSPKSVQAVVSQNEGDYTKYMEEKIELTESTQQYAYTFTMNGASDPAAVLAFGLGDPSSIGDHTVSIHNVSLIEVNPSADQGGQPVNVNLISNGDFSKGTDGWFTYVNGDAKELQISAGDQKLQAKIGTVGQNPWDRQVINEGFGIQPNSKYKLTFKAKTDKPRVMNIGIGWVDAASNYEWHGFFGDKVDLTTEEQLFTFTFNTKENGYGNTRISLDMGNISGAEDGNTIITLSDVSLFNMGSAE
ncbi:carbohydrate binding domain-containing protein [Paenibacillus sp. An7]|uniref:carbohydrate binding domain-containing protein n=1 Tax=Paenibacillus sp. An7 TaxID=2689577 RepID=UPI00135C0394|nr:carbohydrate binding domain-containing protein [Paenibacillus sp. An7]